MIRHMSPPEFTGHEHWRSVWTHSTQSAHSPWTPVVAQWMSPGQGTESAFPRTLNGDISPSPESSHTSRSLQLQHFAKPGKCTWLIFFFFLPFFSCAARLPGILGPQPGIESQALSSVVLTSGPPWNSWVIFFIFFFV